MDFSTSLEVANVSDRGRRRPHNEDSAISDVSLGLLIVADGMGGYRAGEVASAIAVTSIMEQIRTGLHDNRKRFPDKSNELSLESYLLKHAVEETNKLIFDTAQSEPSCQGMGTTVISMLFFRDKYTVAHVGDSRLYRLRADNLQQITLDHSLIQELVNRGIFTREEAIQTTPKNLVTRALGIDKSVEVDIQEDYFEPGDIYLLCSDGLNDMVEDEEIYLTLMKYNANLIEAANQLVKMANDNGGKDNVSIILARPRTRAYKLGFWRKASRKWFRL